MKKIFILTGEPSGDKLASKVISKLKKDNPNIKYSCVGGTHLNSLGIKSIFDLKEITYIGFTSVLLNILKIRKKINYTVEEIIKFDPDILFSVDIPDFTLRVAEKVKSINPNIKNTFVGHPLLETAENVKTDLSNLIDNNKKIISLFAGSRSSETGILLPILIDFIKLMNEKSKEYSFVFHATDQNKNLIKDEIKKINYNNIDVISDEKIKSHILSKSIFAVAKSGTVSLEICHAKVPSIIIYKMNFLNYLIVKMLVKVKYANIINIINDEEIIPELIQNECNPKEIFNSVVYLLKNPELMKKQMNICQKTLNDIRNNGLSSSNTANIIADYIKN